MESSTSLNEVSTPGRLGETYTGRERNSKLEFPYIASLATCI